MTIVITGSGFWRQSPFGEEARQLKLSGQDVQVLHTHSDTLKYACKCGHDGVVAVSRRDGHWAMGECPLCKRPVLIDFVDLGEARKIETK